MKKTSFSSAFWTGQILLHMTFFGLQKNLYLSYFSDDYYSSKRDGSLLFRLIFFNQEPEGKVSWVCYTTKKVYFSSWCFKMIYYYLLRGGGIIRSSRNRRCMVVVVGTIRLSVKKSVSLVLPVNHYSNSFTPKPTTTAFKKYYYYLELFFEYSDKIVT